MITQTLQVFSLRGMDERWIVDAQDALFIQDMFWTSNDSWRTSGGFAQVFSFNPFDPIELLPTTVQDESQEDRDENETNYDPNPVRGGQQKPSDQIRAGMVADALREEAFDTPTGLPAKTEVTLMSGSATSSTTTDTVDKDTIKTALGPVYPKIVSLHWFAQHNGARQWLVFEEENARFNAETGAAEADGTTSLKVFDGSLSKPFSDEHVTDGTLSNKPFKVLMEYGNADSDTVISPINKRLRNDLSIPTQSQSFGGRIYLVNGYDQPLVFDGDICERAGFASTPPAPSATGNNFETSMTFCFATGDGTAYDDDWDFGTILTAETLRPGNIGFYGLNQNVPYWGLGSASGATIGGGSYYWPYGSYNASGQPVRGGEASASTADEHFDNLFEMKLKFYMGEQIDERICGYQYKVTYVNDRGQESEASASSNLAILKNGTGGEKYAAHGKGSITLSVPKGPKECVARRIYRTRNCYDSEGNLYTRGRQRTFYFLTEIPDNMTTQYVDGHPDTALSERLEVRDLGNFPSRTKYLAVFKNTMFAAGSDFNEIQYSAPLFPEVFPKDNVISVGDDDGGPITGMRATKNALVVFKSRGIYLIKGSPSGGFVAQTLNQDIGCVAPNSIAEVPGLGLVFLSEKSVYLLEGALENTGSITGVVNIGAEIPNQLERLNHAASIKACASVYLRDKEYWLAIPIDGSAKNNMCLIYHYEVGSWSVRFDFPIECMLTTKDHRGYLLMGSHDTENKFRNGLLVYTRGSNKKGSTTEKFRVSIEESKDGTDEYVVEILATEDVSVSSIYETVSNDYSSVFSNFRPAHIMAYAVGYGDNGLNVNTRVNRSIDQVRAVSQTGDQQDPNEPYPVYGTALFGKDRWIAYRPVVLRNDISTTHKGPVRELSVSFASANNNKIEIIGYDLEAKVGEQRNIKPLNKALRPSRR